MNSPYKITITSISVIFIGASISVISNGLLQHEIPERLLTLAMGSMAALSALIVSPPKY